MVINNDIILTITMIRMIMYDIDKNHDIDDKLN